MKLVASISKVPNGVDCFIQNGTRTRAPLIGAKAISLLCWAASLICSGV
jgi:hypothetical protein